MAQLPVSRQRWTPPAARLEGDRLLKARAAQQRVRDAAVQAEAEAKVALAQEEKVLGEKVDDLEKAVETLIGNIPKMLPASGGGRRTIEKVLRRIYDLPNGLGSAAGNDTEDFATAEQGGKADSAMQPAVYDPTGVGADAFSQDSMVDGTTNKNYTATEQTKLAGIEALADVTDTANVTAAGAAMTANNLSDLGSAASARSNLVVPTFVADRTALKALDTTKDTSVYVKESGREGPFYFTSADLSATMRPTVGTTSAVTASESINGYSATYVSTITAHGLYTGCPVTPTTSVNGLTAGTTYYVIKLSADKYSLASSRANAIAYTVLTLSGTTNYTLKRVVDALESCFVIPTGKSADGSQGAWVRAFNGAVNLKWFGSTGDGTTDDSAALAAAGDLLSSGFVRSLFVPKGVHYQNTAANRFMADHVTGLHIYGEGECSQIKWGNSAGNRPFYMQWCTGIICEQLYFNSTGRSGGVWDNISLVNSTNVHFRYNKVEGADFYGLGGYGDVMFPDSALYMQSAMDNCNVYRNKFKNCGAGTNGTAGYGVEIFPNVKSYGLSIVFNDFENCGGLAGGAGTAACKGGSAYENALIAFNKIRNSPSSAIHCGTHESVAIIQNEIIDWGQTGSGSTAGAISISLNTHPFYLTPSVALANIRGNIIRQVNAGSNTCYGFSVNGNITTGGPVYIEGNEVIGARGVLMRSTDAVPGVKIRRNTFRGMGVTDIILFGDATSGASLPGVEFIGNTVESLVTNRTTTGFINLVGFTDMKIEDNDFIKGGNIDVILSNCGGTSIVGNRHHEPNVSNTSSTAIINVSDTNSVVYTVMGNEVIKGANGNPKAYYTGNSANPTVRSCGNKSDTLIPLQLNSTPNLGGDFMIVPVPGYTAIGTDANATLTPFSTGERIKHSGTLTADRTLSLSTTNAVAGVTRFIITRTGSGAFNLVIGTTGKNLATSTWCEAMYDGSAYYIARSGSI